VPQECLASCNLIGRTPDRWTHPRTAYRTPRSSRQDAAATDYCGQLRGRCGGAFTEALYRALRDGEADDVLRSLRDPFDKATQALADALQVVDIDIDPRQLAEHGSPDELEAWRSIKPAVQQLDEIAAIARRFGPRSSDGADRRAELGRPARARWCGRSSPSPLRRKLGEIDRAEYSTDSFTRTA
jgi:hypothetical protein